MRVRRHGHRHLVACRRQRADDGRLRRGRAVVRRSNRRRPAPARVEQRAPRAEGRISTRAAIHGPRQRYRPRRNDTGPSPACLGARILRSSDRHSSRRAALGSLRARPLRYREPPDGRRDVRPWGKASDEFLEVTLAPVPCGIEHRQVVLACQVLRQHADRGQCQRPLRKALEDDRVGATCSRGVNPPAGRGLGEVEPAGAVGEERRVPLAHVEPPLVHRGERRHERGRRVAFVGGEARDLDEKSSLDTLANDGMVGAIRALYARVFRALWMPKGRRSALGASRMSTRNPFAAHRRTSSWTGQSGAALGSRARTARETCQAKNEGRHHE